MEGKFLWMLLLIAVCMVAIIYYIKIYIGQKSINRLMMKFHKDEKKIAYIEILSRRRTPSMMIMDTVSPGMRRIAVQGDDLQVSRVLSELEKDIKMEQEQIDKKIRVLSESL